ncbi:cell division protein ZapA [Scatolibacter rhodanostii]|uniref:cell division protein ZapA n=1 Tax=Scatolibacter rhodanostii TaxID=2014781 RepID=UPI000C0853A8|nr:cell division protein ZapA [Scatolibacter rhodanostii]
MEKRRVRLEINGVVCGLITEETDEYMHELAAEIGEMMNEVMAASPFITKESAAVTAALIYLDTVKKDEFKELEKKKKISELEKRNLELERQAAQLRKENNRLSDESAALFKQIENGIDSDERRTLEDKITDLEWQLAQADKGQSATEENVALPPIDKKVKLRNPLRNSEWEENDFVTFFEKKHEK